MYKYFLTKYSICTMTKTMNSNLLDRCLKNPLVNYSE